MLLLLIILFFLQSQKTPQEIRETYINLSKDSDGLLIAISNLDNNQRKDLNSYLEDLRKRVVPSTKKSKTSRLIEEKSCDVIFEVWLRKIYYI